MPVRHCGGVLPHHEPAATEGPARSGEDLEVAVELAYKGKMDQAIALLTKEIRRTPKLWQLHQYRGQLHMLNGAADLALLDINEAIRLARRSRNFTPSATPLLRPGYRRSRTRCFRHRQIVEVENGVGEHIELAEILPAIGRVGGEDHDMALAHR